MNLKTIAILCMSLFLFSACMGKNDYSLQPPKDQPIELTKLSANGMPDQQAANLAKQIISEQEQVEGVRAVNNGDELLIGIKLNHHDRINMDNLEKTFRKKMKRNFSDMKVTLSTDEKIHLELKNLEEDLQANRLSKEKFEKRLQKIIKLSKEET